MQCRRARKAGAGFRDGLHHQGGFGNTEAGTAIGLRDGNAEPTVSGEGAMKVVRETTLAIFGEPILVGESGAILRDGAHIDCCSTEREKSMAHLAPVVTFWK